NYRDQNKAADMKNLIFEKLSDDIGILKINRPEALNALNRDTLYELLHFLKNTLVKEDLKVLILTGIKGKCFVAGADIKEMQKMTPSQMRLFCELGQQVTSALKQAPCVVIGAVDRFALGG